MADVSYRCPDCGVAVEDDAQCLPCYDAAVDADAHSTQSNRQRLMSKRQRDFLILEDLRTGRTVEQLAAKYGVSGRTVYCACERARRREGERRA